MLSQSSSITDSIISSSGINYSILVSDLKKLLTQYKEQSPQDGYGICALEDAVEAAEAKDAKGLQKALKKFPKTLLKFIEQVGIATVSELLVQVLKS